MAIDERYVAAYTRWVKAQTTKEVLGRAQAGAQMHVASIDDSTIQGAAKAHWFSAGAAWVMNALLNQMTTDQLENLKQQSQEPDFNADAIVAQDLMIKEQDHGQ